MKAMHNTWDLSHTILLMKIIVIRHYCMNNTYEYKGLLLGFQIHQ